MSKLVRHKYSRAVFVHRGLVEDNRTCAILETFDGTRLVWAVDELIPAKHIETGDHCQRRSGRQFVASTVLVDAADCTLLPDATLARHDAWLALSKQASSEAAGEAYDAPAILRKAAGHIADRAAARDQAGGERSMARCVAAFNALTGAGLTETQGWLFMAVLKMARGTNTPTGADDDWEDLAAYSAFIGECAHRVREKASE